MPDPVLSHQSAEPSRPPEPLGHSLEHEFLGAIGRIGFRGVQVALRIDGEIVDALKISRLGTPGAKRADDFQGLALDDHDVLIAVVRHVDELLVLVGGQGDARHRPPALSAR